MFGEIGAIMMLGAGSFYDIKNRKIPLWIICIGAGIVLVELIGGLVFGLPFKDGKEYACSVLPGVFMLFLAYFTKEQVGAGDGILLILIGLLTDFEQAVWVLCVGLFIQSLLAVFLIMIRRADKQCLIPFVPFMLVAELIFLWGF